MILMDIWCIYIHHYPMEQTTERIFQSGDLVSLLWDYLYNKWFTVNFEIIDSQQYKIIVTYTQEQLTNLTDSEREVIKLFFPAMLWDNANNIGTN